jgi:hypothetical protein
MTKPRFRNLQTLTFLCLLAAPGVWAGPINGTITGNTVSGVFGDDTVTASTINIQFFSQCPFIDNGVMAAAYAGYNFIYAGQGDAAGIAQIDPSDFTVSGYTPWVGTSTNVTVPGNLAGTGTSTASRPVTNAEAGGNNIVISYTPKAGDPTSINFVQAYIESENGQPFSSGTIDAGGTTPFYNGTGITGTGTQRLPPADPNRIPLVTSAAPGAVAGWMVDIPYTCESGLASAADCSGGTDDRTTSATVTFQTFISSQQVLNGTTYQVLYGGIQWGYTFSTVDTPEPASLFLMGLAIAGIFGYRRRQMLRA